MASRIPALKAEYAEARGLSKNAVLKAGRMLAVGRGRLGWGGPMLWWATWEAPGSKGE